MSDLGIGRGAPGSSTGFTRSPRGVSSIDLRRDSTSPQASRKPASGKRHLTANLCIRCVVFACALACLSAHGETVDEGALIERFGQLPSREAYEAATALGRMGSARGLEVILERGDETAIMSFGAGMSHAHRPVLPPEIEAAIVTRFDRLAKSKAYGGLVRRVMGNSKYQSRALFKLLFAEAHDLLSALKRNDRSRGWGSTETFWALVQTDLPIGKETLSLVRELPLEQSASYVRCALLDFFQKHPDSAAVPALAKILRRAEDEFSMRCICGVLAAASTQESVSAVVEHAQRLRKGDPKLANDILAVLINELRRRPREIPLDLASLHRAMPRASESPDLVRIYVELVRHRKDKSALPILVSYASAENVSDGFQDILLQTLSELGGPREWRRALQDVERGYAAGQVSSARLNRTRSMLEARLDPQRYRDREQARRKEATDAGHRADARFLEEAIARGDEAGVRDFGMGLRSEERPFIPPEIESLMVRHFDDPELASTLEAMVGPQDWGLKRSAYRTRELFDLFAKRVRMGGDDQSVRRMLVTDLPLEAPLLELLEGPGVGSGGCEIAKFLAERRYGPALPVLIRRLDASSRSDPAVRASAIACPAQALLEFGTAESVAEVVRFLDRPGAAKGTALQNELLRKLAAMPPSTPVDFAAVRRALGTPIPETLIDDYVRVAHHRRPLEAVPDLLLLLSQRAAGAALYDPAFHALVAYDFPEVWRRAREEIERLSREGRIGRWSSETARSELDALLAEPDKALAKRRLERPHAAARELPEWEERRLIEELSKEKGQSARDVARALGARKSERGFEILIERRDAALLHAFAGGAVGQGPLTPGTETLVYEHLDDRELSVGLRNLILRTRYRDRRIFDRLVRQILGPELEPRDRAVIAPVIVATELSVEKEVVDLLGRLPKESREMSSRCPMIRFLGERRYEEAVKPLAEELRKASADLSRCISTALVKIGTREGLQAVTDRVRELRTDPATATTAAFIATETLQASKELPPDARQELLAAKQTREREAQPDSAEIAEERKFLSKGAEILKLLRDEGPARHAKAYEDHLDALASRIKAADARKKGGADGGRTQSAWDRARWELALGYLGLGDVVRFVLREPKRALALYEKARTAGLPSFLSYASLLVELSIADTWQFDLADRKKAIEHLRIAGEEVRSTVKQIFGSGRDEGLGEVLGGWLSKWIEEEIRFLGTEKPFQGVVTREAASGIGMFMFLIAGERTMLLQSTLLKGIAVGDDPFGPPPTDEETIAKTLRQLPVSHTVLTATIHLLPQLSADEILRHLERQDPGRYLTAVTLATAALEDHEREIGREPRRYSVMPKPKEGEPYRPSPLRIAAERFFASSGIRVDAPPFKPVIAASPEELDKHLQEVWKQFRQALLDGDLEKALSRIAVSQRKKYREVFEVLLSEKVNVDEVVTTDLHRVEIHDDRAEYAMTRVHRGEARSSMVQFVQDIDGEWRIDTF